MKLRAAAVPSSSTSPPPSPALASSLALASLAAARIARAVAWVVCSPDMQGAILTMDRLTSALLTMALLTMYLDGVVARHAELAVSHHPLQHL